MQIVKDKDETEWVAVVPEYLRELYSPSSNVNNLRLLVRWSVYFILVSMSMSMSMSWSCFGCSYYYFGVVVGPVKLASIINGLNF